MGLAGSEAEASVLAWLAHTGLTFVPRTSTVPLTQPQSQMREPSQARGVALKVFCFLSWWPSPHIGACLSHRARFRGRGTTIPRDGEMVGWWPFFMSLQGPRLWNSSPAGVGVTGGLLPLTSVLQAFLPGHLLPHLGGRADP